MELSQIFITHYYYKDTVPLHNIMALGEHEAFRKAAELAAAYPNTESIYRFADFKNYYPHRKATDEYLYNRFLSLGGKSELEHPLSFVLFESQYLKNRFSNGSSLTFPLSTIADDKLSFTYGDSCSGFEREGRLNVLTKAMLFDDIASFGGSIPDFSRYIQEKYHYIETQVWCSFDTGA